METTYDTPNTIASKATVRGFGIAIVTWPNYRTGEAEFSVVRYNRSGRFVRLSNHTSEANARKAGNVAYKQDRAAA